MDENILKKLLIMGIMERIDHTKPYNTSMYKTKVCNGWTSVFVEERTALAKVKVCLNESFVLVINNPANDNHENDALFKYTTHNVFNLIRYSKMFDSVKEDGPISQAYAIRLAMVKCLLCLDDEIKLLLKANNYILANYRIVEWKNMDVVWQGNHINSININ
ncbi:30S ribosomal subunit protein S9 [Candidatus Hodgkinia cicadicola]|uniref:Small ribosomal subunit protein uS9 n=1 Tax=Candidatus Hodgkinia cicadicola TaxID=573658 RepID=A0ABX4MHI7_9HYPH|nr:30S ribosomal subunit protein S9 [Candidatus Hodgkinia cicadicola]